MRGIKRALILLAGTAGLGVFVTLSANYVAAQSAPYVNFHPQPPSDIQLGAHNLPILNIPQTVYNQYYDHYQETKNGGATPNFRTWVSPAGNPASVSVQVPGGQTTPINVALHFSGVKSHDNNVAQSYERVVSIPQDAELTASGLTTPQNSPDTSKDLSIIYGGANFPNYRRAARGFQINAPEGGFSKERYDFKFNHKIISRRTNGNYNCIKEPNDNNNYGPPSGPTNFGACPILRPNFDLLIIVKPNCTITADKTSIISGEQVKLTWQTFVSRSQVLNPGNIPVDSSGEMTVQPTGTTTYVLTVANSNGDFDCKVTVNVDNPPSAQRFLQVYGNDVMAGGGFGQPCQITNQSASIESYALSYDVGPNKLWKGASSQFAAFALGSVNGFFTANMRGAENSGDPPRPPLGLTFGNSANGSSLVSMNNGGQYVEGGCIKDFFAAAEQSGQDVQHIPLSTLPTDPTQPSVVPLGTHQAGYNEGNVYITGKGLRYAGAETGWSDVSQIPSVVIVVRGNIYIDPTVERLDGIFIAQPQYNPDGSLVPDTGIINTCTNSTGADISNPSTCSTKLTINGAFIAKKVKFKRTGGDLETASANSGPGSDKIAEVFNFSPEIYLSPLHDSLRRSLPFTKYDYITSLPPVL